MKTKLLAIFCATLLFAACGSDDCTQADWVGTYTGTLQCNDGSDPEETSITITAGASENSISIDGSETTFEGCSITMTEVDPYFGAEVTSTLELDGNKLISTVSGQIFGLTVECTFEGSK